MEAITPWAATSAHTTALRGVEKSMIRNKIDLVNGEGSFKSERETK